MVGASGGQRSIVPQPYPGPRWRKPAIEDEALTTGIWHGWATGVASTRSLAAFDH